jgi:hypothetical protein
MPEQIDGVLYVALKVAALDPAMAGRDFQDALVAVEA